jgi:hypothetical protein
MPYRPEPDEYEPPFTREQLKRIWDRLAGLSPYLVKQEYRRSYEECCLDGERIPPARIIQEFVTIWKFLHQLRKRN